jgi:hypothetical protein
MVVAPGRMIDSFLSIPDAESLPLYRMVLKLACVSHLPRRGEGDSRGRFLARTHTSTNGDAPVHVELAPRRSEAVAESGSGQEAALGEQRPTFNGVEGVEVVQRPLPCGWHVRITSTSAISGGSPVIAELNPQRMPHRIISG